MDSPGHVTCFLEVETNTRGWQKPLSKVLTSMNGVTYTINTQIGIAKVSGKIDPGKLMMLLAKAGRYRLLWVESKDPNNPNPQNPNNNTPNFHNGYPQYYYNYDPYNYYSYHPEYYHHPSLYSYPQAQSLPDPYQPLLSNPYQPSAPFYEPLPKYFPQPPVPLEGFNVGDAQWCVIM